MYTQQRKPKAGCRNAIVTGSATRVGRAIAEALIAEGWSVIIHGRNEEQVVNTKREIGATAAIYGDLNHQDTIDALGESVEMFFDGELALLVNNASTFVRDPSKMTHRYIAFQVAMSSACWVY